MLRSMNSAVTALKNLQTGMDVIGNNIANVKTTAFKAGRTTFKDTFSQNIRTASGPREERGGTNPHQVGLGMKIGSIDNNMTGGNVNTTGIGTDCFIDGKGWFQVKSPDGVYYTRDGSFIFDGVGNLATQQGEFVQGYQANDNGDITETIGKIQLPITGVIDPKVTSLIELGGNIDSRCGDGFVKPDGTKIDIPNTLEDLYDVVDLPNGGKSYKLKDVWGTNEKEGKVSVLGGQVQISAIDSLGKNKHNMVLHFIKNDDAGENSYNVFAFYVNNKTGEMIPAVSDTGGGVFPVPGAGFAGTVKFTDHGKIDPDPGNLSMLKFTLQASKLTGAEDLKFSVDLGKLTQFESAQSLEETKNDGYPLGKLNGYMISGDGKVIGTFDNGLNKVYGQIVTATFANDNGLQKVGDNKWIPTLNSGDPSLGKPGEAKHGAIQSGALEQSNVDLAQEFTDMIKTQRGFQANARTITTSDQMLEELVNLKR